MLQKIKKIGFNVEVYYNIRRYTFDVKSSEFFLVLEYLNSLRAMRRLLTNKYEEENDFLQVRVLEVDVVAP